MSIKSEFMSIKSVGIVGSGVMGAGIAELAGKAGFDVVVRSRSQSAADACLAKVAKSLARQVDKDKISAAERDAVLARVRAVTDLGELEYCQLVIESVVEDLGAKKHLFTQLDGICATETILATNTSTLPVLELAVSVSRADRVCGMHFFNPAPVMKLVEIVRTVVTEQDVVDDIEAFAQKLGKVDVTDANADRASGSSWTVTGAVTAAAQPGAGRVLRGDLSVLTADDAVVGRGTVVVQSVS